MLDDYVLSLRGKVVHAKKVSGSWQAGIEFHGLSSMDEDSLSLFLLESGADPLKEAD